MTTLKQAFQNKMIETIANAAEEQVDGREYGKGLDQIMDQRTGTGTSEKIQRGPITNFILEIVEGLWIEDLSALATELEKRAKALREEAAKPPSSPAQ